MPAEVLSKTSPGAPASEHGSGPRPAAVLAFVLSVGFVVLFWQLGTPSFWDPDEAHYAETSREMIQRGDWLAPYYNGQPFFDKPALFHQLQASAMRVFGPTEFAARIVPALAAAALVATTGWLGAALVSADVGLAALLLTLTSPGVFALARYAILDTVFTAFLFGGASLVTVAALRDRRALQWPGYLLVAFAVMVKGPLAFVLCGLSFVVAIAASADLRRRLLALNWIAGLVLAAAAASPWFVYMYLRFGHDFVAGYILDENLRLYAANRFQKTQPPWFYVQVMASGLLPWTPLLLGRLVDQVRAARRGVSPDSFEILLWAWIGSILGFFSLSDFKLDHYVFPATPALAILCARAWAELRADMASPRLAASRAGLFTVGPLLVAVGTGGGYFIIARLDLPYLVTLVPLAVTALGVAVTVSVNVSKRPGRAPWLACSAMAAIFAGAVAFVMPALEQRKVVPDVARWVAGHASPDEAVGMYGMNRWSSSFRFYVDRQTTSLDGPDEAQAFFKAHPRFYCVLIGPAYDELVARGASLRIVYEREGMWATSGRALWRRRLPPTRFVVVTSEDKSVTSRAE